MLSYSTLSPKVYTSVRESGVLLTVRHVCDPRQRRGVSERIWEEILDAFGERSDIAFAYPTQRFVDSGFEREMPRADRPAVSRVDE